MPHEIRVPRLDWSMEEGTFVGWLKQAGEWINVGDPLYEFEGGKAIQAIEASDAGVLFFDVGLPAPGTTVAVGSLLGYLCAVGESPPAASSAVTTGGVDPVGKSDVPDAANAAEPNTPRIERSRSTAGAGDDALTRDDGGSGSARPRVASPRARRLARERMIDWRTIAGSGREGRVRAADILDAAAQIAPMAAVGGVTRLSARRRAIAERMRISRERTVPVTLTTTADASSLVTLHRDFKAAHFASAPSYTELVAWLTKSVLRRHPMLAARWTSDQSGLVTPVDGGFHLGVAVDAPEGLLVPVVRDGAVNELPSFVERLRALIEQARAGALAAVDMQGGVFTVSNLGSYGVDAFTPVINYPETAILGIGAIRSAPAASASGEISLRAQITLNLTFDHAAHDGAPAAAMLRDLALAIEQANPRSFE